MGKSQKKKAIRRHNPVRVPDSHIPHGLAPASASSSKNEAILPIIQKLGSIEATDRTWACAAVSTLIHNDPSTRRLLQGKNIVGALITRLSDAVEEVIVEAAGALRNLGIDGGYDLCAEMYNKNIMATLRTFPTKISVTLQQYLENPKAAPEGAQRLVYEFAENIITIFWCLSETSNKALKSVNDINLIPFLMAFFQARDRLPSSTVNAAAQCLYVLTEENDPAIDSVRTNSSYISCLLEIAQSDSASLSSAERGTRNILTVALRVLVSGILRNISPLPSTIHTSTIDLEGTVILPLLVPRLSVNLDEVTTIVTRLLAVAPDPDATVVTSALGHTPRSDHKTPSEKELEHVEEKLHVTQLTLEILTGICAKLPDPVPVSEDAPDDADVEDNMETGAAVDNELSLRGINGPGSLALPASKPASKSTNSLLPTLTSPLVTLVHPTTLSFPPNPSEPSPHPPTTSALSSIHIRALECLNNLFLAVEETRGSTSEAGFTLEDRDGAKRLWGDLWLALAKVGKVVNEGQISALRGLERKTEMWEIAVGVLWGIARIGRGFLVPDVEQVQALIEFCDANTDDMIKAKCIGTLECLAQNREAIDANKTISAYLFAHLASPSPDCVESCLQSASALIDIYSDEDAPYDLNFRERKGVDALAHALPLLRTLVRGVDKRKPGGIELRRRGEEVLDNLTAFIKYRKALKL